MRKAWKIFVGAAFVAVVALVAAVAVLKSLDFNAYRGLIAEQVEAATGRELVIAGELHLEVSLNPALAVEGLRFANAPWGSRPHMMTLDRLEAEVALLPLISGEVRVKRLVLIGLDVLAEINSQGRGNWELATVGERDEAPDGGTAARLPVVHALRMKDTTVAYRDGRSGRSLAAEIETLEVGAAGPDDPLRVDLVGAYNGAQINAVGRLGTVRRLIEGGPPFPVALEVEALGAKLALEGAVAEPLRFRGLDLALRVEGNELSETVQAARAVFPALASAALPRVGPYALSARLRGLPEALSVSGVEVSAGKAEQVLLRMSGAVADTAAAKGIDLSFALAGEDISPFAETVGGLMPKVPPFRIAGRLADTGGGYAVEGLRVTAGKSDLAGRLALSLAGSRPAVDATLSSRLLDIGELLPPGNEEPAAPGDRRLLPRDLLPFDALKAVDARLSFRAERILAAGAPIADLVLDVVLRDGLLEALPVAARLSKGRVSARARLDASSGRTASMSVRLDVAGVDTGALLDAMEVSGLLTGGALDAKVDLKGQGGSVGELAGSLAGEIKVTLGKGRVHNSALDLAGADLATEALTALNPLAKTEAYTELTCGVVRFTIKDGLAAAENGIAVETPKMNIVGGGTVDLKTEAIDLAVKPEARAGLGLNLSAVAGMVRIKGTLAAPRLGIDNVGVARGAASIGAALATGGLSLLAEGLIGRATADEHACRTALGEAPPARAPAGRPVEAKSPAPPVEAKSPAPPEKEEEEGVGGFLKGLGRTLDKTLGVEK